MKFRLFKKNSNKIEEMIYESNPDMEKEEREMIRGVFGLGETTVRAIMIPRTDVAAISVTESFDEIVKVVIKSGHSRIPVYENTIDNVIGFLHAKDLLPNLAKGHNGIEIKNILRPVMFVPEGVFETEDAHRRRGGRIRRNGRDRMFREHHRGDRRGDTG
jgi:CBS domain containing-hemolysin-like protein